MLISEYFEESVVLMLPRAELLRLIDAHRPVARFFDRGRGPMERGTDIALLKVGDLLNRGAQSCSPDTPIIDAARMMRDAGISSLGVASDGRLTGLVTIRDMSNRVVAEGRELHDPVRTVMTADPITLPPTALGYDVLNIMLERRIGHLPVVEDGRFIGMISQTDLTRVQAITASALIREVAEAGSIAQMARTTARIPGLLLQLVRAHQRHEVITRMITDIVDAVTRRLLDMAQDDLGPAPAAWLWAGCGSQGRQE